MRATTGDLRMRHAREVSTVWVKLFASLGPRGGTRQARVRDTLVHAILSGMVPPNTPVPPTRALAAMLGLSRNTVSLAVQSLIDHGYVIARARSGLYVNPDILESHTRAVVPSLTAAAGVLHWPRRFRSVPSEQRNITKPANWQAFRYPFIYGQFDNSLLPFADWRECEQQSVHLQAMRAWSRDHINSDPELLIEQIQQRLLPARGIWAATDEILVTAGAQMAVYLLSQLLLDRRSTVGIEDPGYPDARNNFALRARSVAALPVDEHGLKLGPELAKCQYVFVTPSHQCPTTVTMPIDRRNKLLEAARTHDIVIFEDDHESELNCSGRPLPALKSLDSEGRVIYIGSLSKTLSHGLRIGYVVGPRELIRELRALRRLVMRHPPANNAHAAARFIAQGYHEAFIRRLNATFRARRTVLLDALAELLPQFAVSPASGGSAVWVQTPRGVDTDDLALAAGSAGILLEPGSVFFADAPKSCRHFRMGYSAIAESQIRDGVSELATLVGSMTRATPRVKDAVGSVRRSSSAGRRVSRRPGH
jgi:GntR family transcriptional regulator/MocR family aminotransferase